MPENKPNWWIYRGPKNIEDLPPPPPWREFTEQARQIRGLNFEPSDHESELVNAALYLRRSLLITGKPGVGKTSLAYAVAHELELGPYYVGQLLPKPNYKMGCIVMMPLVVFKRPLYEKTKVIRQHQILVNI